jgi:ribosomal protein S10
MGLLDDLKNQAETLRAQEEQGGDRSGDKAQYYEKEIHPRMKELYGFLNEMVENLNFIKPETIVNYPIYPGGEKQAFRQGNYKLVIDSPQLIKDIKLTCKAELDKPVKLRVKGEENVKKLFDILASYKIQAKRKDFNDKSYKLTHSDISIEGPLNISIQFIAEEDSSYIQLLLGNFEGPGVIKRNIDIKNINQDFLDKLGRYILREDTKLFALDISEKDKQAIREMVERERAKREHEIAEMERRAEEEKEEQKNGSGLRKLFKKIKD